MLKIHHLRPAPGSRTERTTPPPPGSSPSPTSGNPIWTLGSLIAIRR